MNRRQFNKAIVALSTVASLPAVARITDVMVASELGPKPKSEASLNRIGLVSVGGADGNTLGAIAQGLFFLTRTIAIDTDAFALMSSGADCAVLIGNGAHRPQHPRQAFEMARRREEKIEAAIGDLDLMIVVAGMYGAAGKGITPVLAEIAKRRDIGMLCVAITPAGWQGVNANPRVRYPIKQIQRAGATVFPVKSERIAQTNRGEAASIIQTVRNLSTSIGHALIHGQTHCIDTDGLRCFLEPGGVGAMGFGYATGTVRVETALQQAIAHPLLGMERLLSATGLLINVRGPADLKIREAFAPVRGLLGRLSFDPWKMYTVSVNESIGDKVMVSIIATVSESSTHITV